MNLPVEPVQRVYVFIFCLFFWKCFRFITHFNSLRTMHSEKMKNMGYENEFYIYIKIYFLTFETFTKLLAF